MKTRFRIRTAHLVRLALAGSAVTLIAAMLVAGVPRAGQAGAQEATPAAGETPRTITVTGQGAVTLQPDTASIQVGVDVTQPTLAEAQSQATQQMTAIINAVKTAGVAAKDIQTTNYSVNVVRARDENGNPGKVTGFEVTNVVSVTLRDLGKLGALLDTVVAQGANNVYGINFFVANPAPAASQARTQAVQDAKQKADELAAAAGAHVGRVMSITETSAPSPQPVGMGASAVNKAAAAPVPIEAGSAEIDVDVQVTYELVS